MKILYIAFVRLPTEKAHGLQIMKTCEALAVAGAKVELVIPGRKTQIEKEPFDYYGVAKKFMLTVVKTTDFVQWGMVGFVASLILFSEAVRLQKSFWSADVVYSRDSLILLQYILLGRKCVFEAHRKPTAIDRIVARHAYRVVAINKALKDRLIQSRVDSNKILIAHDAVDPIVTQKTKSELGVREDVPLVVYAGSQKPEKGYDTAKKAEQLAGAKATFIFVQGKSPTETREILTAADVVLVPNSAQYESSAIYTSPMKLFEALTSGARVVASDVPAIREIVDAQPVTFFKPDDAGDLVRAITHALTLPRPTPNSQHTWQARGEHILSFLQKVL